MVKMQTYSLSLAIDLQEYESAKRKQINELETELAQNSEIAASLMA